MVKNSIAAAVAGDSLRIAESYEAFPTAGKRCSPSLVTSHDSPAFRVLVVRDDSADWTCNAAADALQVFDAELVVTDG